MAAKQPRPDNDNQGEDPKARTLANLLAIVILVVLVGGGYFLVNAMTRSRRALDCLSAHRNNCGDVIQTR